MWPFDLWKKKQEVTVAERPAQAPVEAPVADVASAEPATRALQPETQAPQIPYTVDVSGFGRVDFLTHLHSGGAIASMDDKTRSDLRLLDRINQAAFEPLSPDPDFSADVLRARQQARSATDLVCGYLDACARHHIGEAYCLATERQEERSEVSVLKEQLISLTDATPAVRAELVNRLEAAVTAEADASLKYLRESAEHRNQAHNARREADYYRRNPEVLNELTREHPFILGAKERLPLSRVAVEGGLIAGDPQVAEDLVNGIVARKYGRDVTDLKTAFPKADLMTRYEAKPSRYERQVRALGESIEAATPSLDGVMQFNKGVPMVEAIEALRHLTAVQMHDVADLPGSINERMAMFSQLRQNLKGITEISNSLVWHYLNDETVNRAAGDPRHANLRDHVRAELERRDFTLLSKDDALARAAEIGGSLALDLASRRVDDPAARDKIASLAESVGAANDVVQTIEHLPELRMEYMRRQQAERTQEAAVAA